ncbi:MAG TPA: glycoside hydrolase N-terminal domain-containing protein [Verrucomicrobiae bacterium]|nr:glycoside hydrolase N-terminal domain-containing protein [Verrucomicrobiae bacterium]
MAKADFNPDRIGFSYTYPTNYSDWEDAFLAGNGKMGIMVFGNPLNDTIIYNDRGFNLAANTNSLTRSFAQVSEADLMAIKSNCAAGNFAAANKLAVTSAHYQGGGDGSRHPGYEMLIAIPPAGTISNYSRICNFRTGEIIVKWADQRGNWERRAFVSKKDNIIVQYLTAPSKGLLDCSIRLDTDPGMNFWVAGNMSFTNISDMNYLNMRVKYPPNTGTAGYEGVTRVLVKGGTASMNGITLEISNATSVILLTRTAKYYSDCEKQWDQRIIQNDLATLSTDYDALLQGQLETHQAIYDRVKIDLGTSAADRAKPNEELLAMQRNSSVPIKALWERIFDAGRYYYLSSSSDVSPPDLLGIWTGDCNAGWGGFYHLDANANLQVAQGNIGDMPEAMAGYFSINERWREAQEINAKKLLGCRGMVACGNTPGMAPEAALMAGINEYYPYQYATGEEPWLLYPFWEHYLITGDTNFLKNDLYPLLKDMGEFYEDFLKLKDANGNYIFAGSVSPENQPANVHVSLLNNSVFDVSGAKFALTVLIQTCDILRLEQGVGQGVERWKNILNKLPPYLINSDGAIQEWSWPGLKDNYIHRHMSQLLPVWPYREITLENTPALFNAAAVVLAKKDSYHEVAGHGILHGALIAANLENAVSVNKRLLQLTKEDYYYNSLSSSHNNHHGTFCTDTCNTVPAIMMEMLIGSSPGVLELLPALPQTLDAGAISGVKGRNRVTIQSLSWNIQSNSVNCTLKSDVDQDMTLIERDGIKNIYTSATIERSPLGEIARIIHLPLGIPMDISIDLDHLKLASATSNQPGSPSLSLNRSVVVSSVADGCPGSNAVDGDENTRWSSAYTDNEWIYVDLGSVKKITAVRLCWEAASAKSYKIQVSNDAINWEDVYAQNNGRGGVEKINFNASGKYVRMLGLKRNTTFGYSLWEFEVYGS